jgi:hypothetical protein
MPVVTAQAPLNTAALGAFAPLRRQGALQPQPADAVIQEFGNWKVYQTPMIPRSARWLHMSHDFYSRRRVPHGKHPPAR